MCGLAIACIYLKRTGYIFGKRFTDNAFFEKSEAQEGDDGRTNQIAKNNNF
jgi:hypothetical protein